ncbi:hypothetical protein [Desmospora activa]|uniref:Uncharacterized protein n=1 Tax=Desmospora activa DSM 45169 TaxID=1121389 RepID=A0A2T4ZDK3_9BACL|nr:hypothetical protein [Desmospora activa]PTM59974.1 hypothetical protein C8J48_2613 [Desmospora activa DSM 45169]
MDLQKKKMMAIILRMVKEVYQKTTQLESVLQSGSVQLLSRSYDPLNEMLEALEYPPEQMATVYELLQVYLEDQMTLDEVIIGIENGWKQANAG